MLRMNSDFELSDEFLDQYLMILKKNIGNLYTYTGITKEMWEVF